MKAVERPGCADGHIAFACGNDDAEGALASEERFGVMVGRSRAMRLVFSLLERAGRCDTTVLLEGETGTGKEAAAESIHQRSARRAGPFIIVDCGAVPPSLLESELFGHEAGAFTGAASDRVGAFEAADGGTLFLDEIGELSLDLQPKLLRAIERREVKRVGSTTYRAVDIRIIAATHRDLEREVNEQRFRSDLYYRLAVLRISIPPLRDRTEDLPALVEALLERLGASARPEADLLRTPELLQHITRHSWPGNVRELRNYMERCLALSQTAPLEAERRDASLGVEVAADLPLREARDAWLRHFEQRYLSALLARHRDNVAAAARAAGVDRPYFYRLLWRYKLR